MLTPTYALTATERILPNLAIDFTTAITDPRVSVARSGNTATRINSSGVIEIVNANLPRYAFDPVTLVCKGQLIESARTNLFLNSLIDGTSLATQSVTLTAAAHTISFYGSGSITISGGHSAAITGTGAYPTRTTYVFTPTAGSSTFTVSGTVQFAQIELGNFASSFIPTAGSSVLRNADLVTMTGTNFSSWYNVTEGTFVVSGNTLNVSASRPIIQASTGATSNGGQYMYFDAVGPRFALRTYTSAGAVAGAINYTAAGSPVANTTYRWACGYKTDAFIMAANGNAVTSDNTGEVSGTPDTFRIGNDTANTFLNGYIEKVQYYPMRLINDQIQAFSKQ